MSAIGIMMHNPAIHEWKYNLKDRPELVVDEYGMLAKSKPEPIENLITWVFDEGPRSR